MPEFDAGTITKITNLRTDVANGERIQVFEMVKVEWPSPTGTKYYSATKVDAVAASAPVSGSLIEARLIPDSTPDWFLVADTTAAIGDDEVQFELWDGDEVISQLLVDHGEGIKTTLYYWFPAESLFLPIWVGHLRLEEEMTVASVVMTAVQGFRSSESNLPGRLPYQYCSAMFGGLFTTQAEIDEHDCPYNKQIGGGTVGNNDPGTGLPWTYCDRKDTQSCTDRGVDPLYHLSHATIQSVVVNSQTSGNALFSTSQGNETNLTDPVRVVMGTRRIYGMKVMAFRRDLNNNHPDQGWFYANYQGCEGPVQTISQARIKVGGQEQDAVPLHYNYRLGTKGQTAPTALTTHGYSGTAYIVYNFGWCNPAKVSPEDAEASAVIAGLNDIRIYSNTTTYSTGYTTNRAWQILHMLCNKRWGYGLDYARIDIQSFIDAATWCAQAVTYTDPFGTDWVHTRSESNVELVGKKVAQQIEDFCRAGRLSRPFWFNGKLHIVPLKKHSSGELSAAPVFTDEGSSPNIIREAGRSTLAVSRRSSFHLTNRIECTFDDIDNDYLKRPLRPIEDVDAQLAAGRATGDKSQQINRKEFSLLGVVHEAQATKLGWSLLDLGEFDDGGLQNNLRLKFKIWLTDGLDLHPEKLISVTSSKLDKYGFTYFRVKKILRASNLVYEIEAQAYNEDYMATFEVDYVSTPPTSCSIDSDCPAGYECINGVCVRVPPPPVCELTIGTVSYVDGFLTIPVEPC